MNGIIYRMLVFVLLFMPFGCKDKLKKDELKNKNKNIHVNDIKFIAFNDTLFLNEEDSQFGKEWIKYRDNKALYNQILVKNKKLDKETFERLKTVDYLDKESIEYLTIRGRIKLNSNFNSLITTNPEMGYVLFNYNQRDELTDFIDLNTYNNLYCQCKSKLFIDHKGIITGVIESGPPHYKQEQFKVNEKGKFEIIDEFIPQNLEDITIEKKLDFIIERTDLAQDSINLYIDSGPEAHFPRAIFIRNEDLKTTIFSKNGKINLFLNAIENEGYVGQQLIDLQESNFFINKKIFFKDKIILIAYPDDIDDFYFLFILDSNKKVIDVKIFEYTLDENLYEIILEKQKDSLSLNKISILE